MTALNADRNTVSRKGDDFEFPVKAAVKIFAGAIVGFNAGAAVLTKGLASTTFKTAGIAVEQADNTNGNDSDITVKVRRGCFRFANSAAADEITLAQCGDNCYVVDDQTVAKTDGGGTRSIAGIIEDVDAAGVWVTVGYGTFVAPGGGLLAANNLSDVGAAATARANLGGGANKVVVPMGDVSLVGATAAVLRTVAPVAGTVDVIRTVLNGALTTGDATLTGKIGAVAITTGVVTITQAASAAGDVDSVAPTAAKTVAVGDVISVTVGGTNDAAVTANVVVTITPSA